MHLSRIALLTACAIAVIPGTVGAASNTDCAFSESFAMRSGELPFAGTLDQQVAASMDNVYATSDRSSINYTYSVGGAPSVKITAYDGTKTIREILYVNKGGHSYQLNLEATPATYARQKKNLRILLRMPFGEQLSLCN